MWKIKRKIIATCILFILICLGAGCATKNRTLTPDQVVDKYYYTDKWEDRLEYVRNPEDVAPLMEQAYKGIDFKENAREKLEYNVIDYDKLVIVEADSGYDVWPYFCVKEEDGYKIDWEASKGINPMSWVEFKATRPTTPQKFRVIASLDDYYNYDYSDKRDTHWSIQLDAIDYTSITGYSVLMLNGYVPKNSIDGMRLFELLKSGNRVAIILEMNYLPKGDDSSNVVEITQFVSDTLIEDIHFFE